jgi:hypothetical protein
LRPSNHPVHRFLRSHAEAHSLCNPLSKQRQPVASNLLPSSGPVPGVTATNRSRFAPNRFRRCAIHASRRTFSCPSDSKATRCKRPFSPAALRCKTPLFNKLGFCSLSSHQRRHLPKTRTLSANRFRPSFATLARHRPFGPPLKSSLATFSELPTHIHIDDVDARPASPPGYSPELVDREPPVNFCTQTGPTSTPPTSQPFDPAAVSRRDRSNADPKVRIDRIPPFRGCRCNKLLPITPTLRPLAWWIYPLGLNPSIPCRQLNALQRLESAALQPRGSWPPFGIEQPNGLAPALGIRPQLPRERTQRTKFPGYRPPRKHHPVQAVTCSCPGRIEPCIGPESPRFLCTCPTPFLLVAENTLIRAP